MLVVNWEKKYPEKGVHGVHKFREEGMATHSSVLAWRIPWTDEPGRLQSMGLERVEHDGVINTFTFYFQFS